MTKILRLLSVPIFLLMTFHLSTAQQPRKLPRIGYLSTGSLSSDSPNREVFLEGMRDLGYIEGKNAVIEYRYAEGNLDRLPNLAAELVRLKVDVIFAAGTRPTLAARHATQSIPIVMISSDPLGSRLVETLARPGGNITGLSFMAQELGSKRLELFREAFPRVRHLAILWNAVSDSGLRATKTAAEILGFKVLLLEVATPEDLERAFTLLRRERADGLFTFTSSLLTANRKRIVEFAAESSLPAIYHHEEFVEDGGLMSYGTNYADLFRRAAAYIDKILRGAKPGGLPVEQPTKFDLVINLKTAEQLGVTIPPSVLYQASKVIR